MDYFDTAKGKINGLKYWMDIFDKGWSEKMRIDCNIFRSTQF